MPKDMTLEGLHNRKRVPSFGVYGLSAADIAGEGAVVANIPSGTTVLGYTLLSDGAVTKNATAVVTIGGLTVIDEMPLDISHNNSYSAAGAVSVAEFTVGGQLVIKAGDVTPITGSIKFILEYLELNKVTGEYTK